MKLIVAEGLSDAQDNSSREKHTPRTPDLGQASSPLPAARGRSPSGRYESATHRCDQSLVFWLCGGPFGVLWESPFQ